MKLIKKSCSWKVCMVTIMKNLQYSPAVNCVHCILVCGTWIDWFAFVSLHRTNTDFLSWTPENFALFSFLSRFWGSGCYFQHLITSAWWASKSLHHFESCSGWAFGGIWNETEVKAICFSRQQFKNMKNDFKMTEDILELWKKLKFI